MKPLLSVNDLASRLQVPAAELHAVANNIDHHYHRFTQRREGKSRQISAPDTALKRVQQRILRRLLYAAPRSDIAHGGIPGRSLATNASAHLGQSVVVNMDVRDFFPSISHRRVAAMFRQVLGCGRDTTWLLTRLTTLDGGLPQGAPTSPMIANLVLSRPLDSGLAQLAAPYGVALTRYVDDITLSGQSPESLINPTARLLSHLGLRAWRQPKLRIQRHHRRQEVTGVAVNDACRLSIPRQSRDRVRAAIHQLLAAPEAKTSTHIDSVKGRINFVHQFNPGAASRLRHHLMHDQRRSKP